MYYTVFLIPTIPLLLFPYLLYVIFLFKYTYYTVFLFLVKISRFNLPFFPYIIFLFRINVLYSVPISDKH